MSVIYLMKFTGEELEVIYKLAEAAPTVPAVDFAEDAVISSIIDKVCADSIGPKAHPVGAIGTAYDG